MPIVYNPHFGGVKIPERSKEKIRKRILDYAQKHYAGKYTRIDVRFHGHFCYIDAYTEPEVSDDFPPPGWGETREEYIQRMRNTPTHLCRLRHFSEDSWSLAFYTYSNEKYEPAFFPSGSYTGTVEEGFEVGAMYIR